MSMAHTPSSEIVRVMIVDDHEIVRRGIAEIIDRADGLDVVAEAGSRAEAVRRAELVRPDVILVDLQLPEDSMQVLADPDALTRVLYNLMDNAVKFAAPGSTLCVSLWKSEGKAYVSVRDHGETIPPDDLPFIFDRFQKSDRSRSLDRDGVGLGLYLVKSILDAHGEDIAVTSRDGVTEFVFTLTLAKPAPKPTAKPESTGRRGGRKSS